MKAGFFLSQRHKAPIAASPQTRAATGKLRIIDLPQKFDRALRHYAILHSGFCRR